MRAIIVALGAVFWGVTAHAADPAVTVTFVNPQSYIDATFDRPRSEKNLREVQEGLRREFARLTGKFIPAGQSLAIDVTGIDLAGRLEPAFATGDIRVLQSVTWPRLQFTYAIFENGVLKSSGEADIHDSGYLDGFNTFPAGDRLRYERQLLSDWFRSTFGRKAV